MPIITNNYRWCESKETTFRSVIGPNNPDWSPLNANITWPNMTSHRAKLLNSSNLPAVPPQQSVLDASPPEQTNRLLNRWLYWTLDPFCWSHIYSHLFCLSGRLSWWENDFQLSDLFLCEISLNTTLSNTVMALRKCWVKSASVSMLWQHNCGRGIITLWHHTVFNDDVLPPLFCTHFLWALCCTIKVYTSQYYMYILIKYTQSSHRLLVSYCVFFLFFSNI